MTKAKAKIMTDLNCITAMYENGENGSAGVKSIKLGKDLRDFWNLLYSSDTSKVDLIVSSGDRIECSSIFQRCIDGPEEKVGCAIWKQ